MFPSRDHFVGRSRWRGHFCAAFRQAVTSPDGGLRSAGYGCNVLCHGGNHMDGKTLRSAWGTDFLPLRTRKISCDGCAEKKRHIYRQGYTDELVAATLERSGLIEVLQPLQPQRRDPQKEGYINDLFEALVWEQEQT